MSIGIPWEVFWHLNPKKLQYFQKAHRQKIEEIDFLLHAWVGNYGLSAIGVAIEHCLHGKKAKSEYIKEPIMSGITSKSEEKASELSEEEIIKQTELLFMKLQVMGANHNLNNKDSSV